MARLKFCGFDYTFTSGNSVVNSTTFTSGVFDFSLDSGMKLQSFSDDSLSYDPGQSGGFTNIGYQGRNSSDGGCMGYRAGSGNAILDSLFAYTQGVTCTRSTLGNPAELWVTMDICHSLAGNVDNPAIYERDQSRFQIFKWGDLSFRIRRIFNWATGPTRCDITFELFNVASSLGTITLTSVNANQWMHVRIHAKLDASAGAFEVSVDGVASNHTAINTVATTPLASATQLWFSGGSLGLVSGSISPFSIGSIDNLLIDNAAFPAGRPSGRRVAISADNTVSGFAATSGGTLTAAVASIDSDYARGTGVGAYVRFDLAAVVTTGLNADILGFQLQACGVSNVDFINAKKLIGGIHLSGTNYDGTNWAGMTPPLTPSFVSSGTESIFYKGGTTNFTLTDIPNCKPRLEVANV